MNEYTELPWEITDRNRNGDVYIGNADNRHMIIVVAEIAQAGIAKEKAELIVHACNEYEKLVKLLELADCPHCDGSGSYHHRNGIIQCQWCDETKAVIEQANKET